MWEYASWISGFKGLNILCLEVTEVIHQCIPSDCTLAQRAFLTFRYKYETTNAFIYPDKRKRSAEHRETAGINRRSAI